MRVITAGDNRYIVRLTTNSEEHGLTLRNLTGGTLIRDHKTGEFHLCDKILEAEYEEIRTTTDDS